MKKFLFPLVVLLCQIISPGYSFQVPSEHGLLLPKSFVHPGLLQSREDLEFMKQQIQKGKREWKKAFEKLQKDASLDFEPQPFTHVVRGSYGREGQGHRELSASALAAYQHALLWYITNNRAHAEKAIGIINAWSTVLWDFDGNDAKLIAGLTGQNFLNAAEILRYSDSGWQEREIEAFTKMMLTVFYPVIRNFFTEANGNWDAAMINTLLCMGIFTDKPEIFSKAVDRFYWGPNNGGITKYIYPNGQIQESTRDWPHVQLGLGELARAAQVAWTQGVDLYEVADNRLALGYEYTAKYMVGEEVPVYGIISPRGRGEFRDIYGSVFLHYTQVKGLEMPYTAQALEHTRPESSLMFLTATRDPVSLKGKSNESGSPLEKAQPQTGALDKATASPPENAVWISPEEEIQLALDKAALEGKWVVLEKGVHALMEPLRMPSGLTLSGEGRETVLFLDPKISDLTISNKEEEMHNVTIRDLLIEGAVSVDPGSDPNQGRRARARQSAQRREGIVFSAQQQAQMKNIRFKHLTVQNFTKHGVSIRGAEKVSIENCDFSDNGSNVVPGEGLHHNLHLTRSNTVQVANSRFSNSPWGNGIAVSFCKEVSISNNETARNKLHGIYFTESFEVQISNNLVEGNDDAGIQLEKLMDGVSGYEITENISRNNRGLGIQVDDQDLSSIKDNTVLDNREEQIQGWTSLEYEQEIKQLFERLDLNRQGLERVEAAEDNPFLAARELLAYYRKRDFVKHPIERNFEQNSLESMATDKDLEIAENALRHIFVGQPAYQPYFCGEEIDWSSSPVKDKEWVWQLNRMTFWDALAKAYRHTQEEKYAREWAFQVLDWIRKNPRDEEHQYAWRSIEAGIRGHRWTGLFHYFVDSPNFTPEVLVGFLNSFYDHASFLMTKNSQGSNWALMESEGMAFIAITFPEFLDAEEWREEAIGRLNYEITNQVYSDGHQRELAFGYHMGSIGWFMRTYELAHLNGLKGVFSDDYLQTIEKMCEVPLKLAFPDGTTPQFGDAWTGTPGQYYGRLLEWGKLFEREDFIYVATEGKEGQEPGATAFALKESGLYSMRNGWDKEAICLVLKCGPDGGGHSQPDNGTFELYAGGRNLMPDTGSFIYSGDPENRAWFRQTKVHQTLTLNEENAAYDPSLLLWQPGEDLDILVVENQSYANLAHRRAIFFVDKSFFIIVDEAIGEGVGKVDLNFQLAPGEADISPENLTAQTAFEAGWNLLIQTQKQENLLMEEVEGQVSFAYTQKEPRPAFRYRIHKEQDKGLRFITIVAPYQQNPPKIDIRLLGDPEIGNPEISLEIEHQGNEKQFGYNLPLNH
jgi:parallel beta-helix repeat protein